MLAEEQADSHLRAQEAATLRKVVAEAAQDDVDDDSDEDLVSVSGSSSSEEEEEEEENRTAGVAWPGEITNVRSPPLVIPSGPQLPRQLVITPLSLLQCLLPDATLDIVVTNTNAYAATKGADSGWQTTREELWLFIAVHICMGIVKLPHAHMYWEQMWRQPFVASAFTRNRFIELLRYFYVAPPTPPDVRHSASDKIAPLIDSCQRTFPAHYNPIQQLAVDEAMEAMVPFRGRSKMKQFMPKKPHKWGYKIWCLACNGYLLNFIVYKGRHQHSGDLSYTNKVVADLTQPYQQGGHTVYLDQFFTNPTLADYLLSKGIRICGTMKKNRKGRPADMLIKGEHLDKGDMVCWEKGGVGCLAWMDKRPVYLLSSHTRIDQTTTVADPHTNDPDRTVTRPTAVHDYNQYKGGVDVIDQLHSYYAIGRKSRRTWPRLAWWLIDVCIINAYRLFTLQSQPDCTHLHFREQLMQQLAAAYPPQQAQRQLRQPAPMIRPAGDHWPKRTDDKRDCRYCSHLSEKRVTSIYKCKVCEVHLCMDPCFELWHVARDIAH